MHTIQQAISAGQSYSEVRKIIQNNTDLLSETTEQENNLLHIFILMGRHDLANKLLIDLIKDIQKQSNKKSCYALVTTAHALLLKLNNNGLSVLHLAARKGILGLLKTTLLASNDITLIGLALTHCNQEGESIQHIVLKKIIELRNIHGKDSINLQQYIKIFHLILSISSELHLENIALFWYTYSQCQQWSMSDHILELLTRMAYTEINHLIEQPEQDCETIVECALMLTDTLLLQDNDGNNALHLIAISQYQTMLKISLQHLSAYQIAIALQVKNMNKKSLLMLLYEQNHDKDDVIEMTRHAAFQLSQRTVCPKVFIIFYISLIECREHIENKEKQLFSQLRKVTTEVLQEYLAHTVEINKERTLRLADKRRVLANELENIDFIGRVSAIDLDKIRQNQSNTKKKSPQMPVTKRTKHHTQAFNWIKQLETSESEQSITLGTSTNKLQTILQQASSANKQVLSELKSPSDRMLSLFTEAPNEHEKEVFHNHQTVKKSP